jgi:hypothetical protein
MTHVLMHRFARCYWYTAQLFSGRVAALPQRSLKIAALLQCANGAYRPEVNECLAPALGPYQQQGRRAGLTAAARPDGEVHRTRLDDVHQGTHARLIG